MRSRSGFCSGRPSSRSRQEPVTEESARQLFQFGKRRVGRTGADFTGVLGKPVEPRIDVEHRPLAYATITAVDVLCIVAQTADIAQPAADDALYRLRHRRVLHA